MECKYTKYTVIEIVPIELKSYKTPLYTIFNSILLWIYLILYFIYDFITKIFNRGKSIKGYFSNKYSQVKIHKESVVYNNPDSLELIDQLIMESSKGLPRFISSESEIFKGSSAKKIFENLYEDSSVLKSSFVDYDLRIMGSYIIRKEIILIESEFEIENRIILTRAFSRPVKIYLDFMLKKIF